MDLGDSIRPCSHEAFSYSLNTTVDYLIKTHACAIVGGGGLGKAIYVHTVPVNFCNLQGYMCNDYVYLAKAKMSKFLHSCQTMKGKHVKVLFGRQAFSYFRYIGSIWLYAYSYVH